MPTDDFIRRLQERTAKLAIGASTLRGKGNTGAIAAARQFLEDIDLRIFAVNNEAAFVRCLDEQTNHLQNEFGKVCQGGGPAWGGARKSINIFLRDVVYNADLINHFNLTQIRPWLEVPLDSQVAKGLQLDPEGKQLPRWPGVKYLERQQSDHYQNVASTIAKSKHITRIDLDIYYWRNLPEDSAVAPN